LENQLAGLWVKGYGQIKNQIANIKNEEFSELMDSSPARGFGMTVRLDDQTRENR
jgi:hypothetical protein